MPVFAAASPIEVDEHAEHEEREEHEEQEDPFERSVGITTSTLYDMLEPLDAASPQNARERRAWRTRQTASTGWASFTTEMTPTATELMPSSMRGNSTRFGACPNCHRPLSRHTSRRGRAHGRAALFGFREAPAGPHRGSHVP